jgi:type I site-specific restriction endonuclease
MNKKALSERDICTKFITPALKQAGWDQFAQTALCDRLEAQLTTTQTQSRRLLEATLHQALATT